MTRLRQLKEASGLKSAELARRMNITRQCVCIAEKKGIRNVAAAQRYAAALGCDWRELLDDGESDRSDLLATAEACADGSDQSDASKK